MRPRSKQRHTAVLSEGGGASWQMTDLGGQVYSIFSNLGKNHETNTLSGGTDALPFGYGRVKSTMDIWLCTENSIPQSNGKLFKTIFALCSRKTGICYFSPEQDTPTGKQPIAYYNTWMNGPCGTRHAILLPGSGSCSLCILNYYGTSCHFFTSHQID